MLKNILFSFVPFLVIMLSLLGFTSYLTVKGFSTFTNFGPVFIKLLTIASIAMPILMIATMLIGNYIYSPIINYLYTPAMLWLPILIYLFIGVVILSIIHLIFPSYTFTNLFGSLILIIVFVSVAYGVYNATSIRTTNYILPANNFGAEMSGKKVVLVSDVHLGIVRGKDFMQKVVNKINEQNPDIVLIAGDLIDGPMFPFSIFLSPLANINSKSGIYYIDGNHEKYTRRYNDYMTELSKLPITILNNKGAKTLGIQIIGFDYKMNYTKDELANILKADNYDTKIPSIAMLHDPKYSPVLSELGMNLVVSGHTHGGQFFPINFIVKSLYGNYTYGKTEIGNNYHITTSGVGTAMTPMRLGTNPEIVTIEFK